MKILAALVMAGLLSNWPAKSEDECITKERMIAHMVPAIVQEDLTGAAAEDFLFKFNAMPPTSWLLADEILIFYLAEPIYQNQRVVVLFRGGCGRWLFNLEKETVLELLSGPEI